MKHKQDTDTKPELFGNLLEERLLHYRRIETGERIACTLPDLFIAMARDEVRDFPALRPHQRHPWHAFLVQLAAIALHRSNQTEPFDTAQDWKTSLLALTPNDPDGAAWCLVSPVDRPAFMQAPEPSGSIGSWKNCLVAADELDMLVTSKNHEVKPARMTQSTHEDWLYALLSLQTQEGFFGAGNWGISRMNGGSANKCGVGIQPKGGWGSRWMRDVTAVFANRKAVMESFEFAGANGHALIWIIPWSGDESLSFASLDPWYIEICRRVRFRNSVGGLSAVVTGSKAPRISAKERNGITGDPWMPVDGVEAKALTISSRGFDYRLATELLLGSKFSKSSAQIWLPSDDADGVHLIAQGVARGQGKTEGYHERRIPVSKTVRKALLIQKTDELAKLANERIASIDLLTNMLELALVVLFNKSVHLVAGEKEFFEAIKKLPASAKRSAGKFAVPFETQCDSLFFQELITEIEAADRGIARNRWLLTLADRAEMVLLSAFDAGPRSGQLRYRAQSAALTRLRSAMRGNKLPALTQALKTRKPPFTSTHEESHEHA
jgi:CRISPR system Cascade subunit CasA